MSDLMPEGKYLIRGIKAALCETQEGKPQIGATVVILQEGDYAGLEMNWYGPLTGKDAETELKNRTRTIEALQTLGWTGDDLSEDPLPGIGSADPDPIGVIKHDTYKGVTRAKIAWINKPGAGFKAMEVNAAAKVARDLKGLIAKVKASTPAAPTPKPAPAPRPTAQAAMQVDDSEIPF